MKEQDLVILLKKLTSKGHNLSLRKLAEELGISGDVVFTATAEYRHWQKTGKSLPTFLGGEKKLDI